MTVARSSEAPQTWFRSERLFASNGKWFFHTREGVDVGPYDSQFEAEIEAAMLKELLLGRTPGEEAKAVIREFVLESYAMGRPLAAMSTA
ncbi:MAG: DUF6316 family protein [Pseudomonadales bacterium]